MIELEGRLTDRDAWTAEHCPMAATLGIVSTRTAFLLLREAYYGATRFEEFTARAQLSDPVASARLKELVEHGLLTKEPYREPGQRTRHAYRLTAKGEELLPALVALMDWGRKHVEGKDRVELRHAACGAPVHAELRCEHGHGVTRGEIALVRTPRRAS